MDKYSLEHLSEGAVLRGVKPILAQERGDLALVLAHLGEIEACEYYKPAGYSSMHMYCVHELKLSKDAAYKRITAARLAREFPSIFVSVAEGALRLSALNILAAHLTTANADELLAASAFRSDFEVREVLAERLPQAPVPTTIEPIAEQVALDVPQESEFEHAGLAAQRVQGDVNPLQVKPIAADMYKATFTMSRRMRDKLRRLKDLLGYRKEAPDEAELLETGVDLYIAQLEKRKFGATDRPRATRRSPNAAYISRAVRRQVFERDGRRCTFESEDGVRCPETRGIECDHIEPVARGGTSEPSNLRLRCRAHNQLEAERTFGKAFIANKRERAKAAAPRLREESGAPPVRAVPMWATCRDDEEVVLWLLNFKYSEEDARWAVDKAGPNHCALPGTRQLRCLNLLRERERMQPPAVA